MSQVEAAAKKYATFKGLMYQYVDEETKEVVFQQRVYNDNPNSEIHQCKTVRIAVDEVVNTMDEVASRAASSGVAEKYNHLNT
jgi:hypothetical protein